MGSTAWRWIGGLVVVAGIGLGAGTWWLRGNLDAMVRRAIVHYGHEATQARVQLDAVEIRSTDGTGVLRGLVIGNPPGFRTEHALKVALVEVAVDLATLADPVVVVRRIVVDAPDVIYEKGATQTNFDALQRNIARAVGAAAGASAPSGGDGAPRRLVVDELVIRNARAQASSPALAGRTLSTTLPDIRLRHVGRAQGGLTPAQLGDVVARALMQRLTVSFAVERAMKSIGDTVKGLFSQ